MLGVMFGRERASHCHAVIRSCQHFYFTYTIVNPDDEYADDKEVVLGIGRRAVTDTAFSTNRRCLSKIPPAMRKKVMTRDLGTCLPLADCTHAASEQGCRTH